MSKSPCTPPTSANKKVFKFFSRTNLRKDNLKEKHPAPFPPTPSHPRPPARSFSSSRNQADENVPPILRIDVQFNRSAPVTPYPALDKFPNPPPLLNNMLQCNPLSSSRSWQNLRRNEFQDTPLPLMPRSTSQKKPRPRPKGILVDPQAYREYLLNGSPASATATIDICSLYPFPIKSESHSPKSSPLVNLLSSCTSSDEESDDSPVSVDLDDYPWYFVEMTEADTKKVHCLSPLASTDYFL